MHKPPTTTSNLIHLFQLILPTAGKTTCLSAWSRAGYTFTLNKQKVVFRVSQKVQQTYSTHRALQGEQDRGPEICRIIEDSKDVIENRKIVFLSRSLSGKSGLNVFK